MPKEKVRRIQLFDLKAAVDSASAVVDAHTAALQLLDERDALISHRTSLQTLQAKRVERVRAVVPISAAYDPSQGNYEVLADPRLGLIEPDDVDLLRGLREKFSQLEALGDTKAGKEASGKIHTIFETIDKAVDKNRKVVERKKKKVAEDVEEHYGTKLAALDIRLEQVEEAIEHNPFAAEALEARKRREEQMREKEIETRVREDFRRLRMMANLLRQKLIKPWEAIEKAASEKTAEFRGDYGVKDKLLEVGQKYRKGSPEADFIETVQRALKEQVLADIAHAQEVRPGRIFSQTYQDISPWLDAYDGITEPPLTFNSIVGTFSDDAVGKRIEELVEIAHPGKQKTAAEKLRDDVDGLMREVIMHKWVTGPALKAYRELKSTQNHQNK